MKITFVTSFLTVFGGAGKFLRDYANKFCEKGHDITVVAQKIDQKSYRFDNRISLIEVGGHLQTHPFHWIRFNKIKKKYVEILSNLDSDLLISLHFPSNYFCACFNKTKKIKHIYYCLEPFRAFHDKVFISNAPTFQKIIFWILKLRFKKFDIEGALAADKIISISNFIRKRVKECYDKDSIVHYIGVDIHDDSDIIEDFNIMQKLNIKGNFPIFLALGYTHHMKGARELIYIFNKILMEISDATLLIGGWMKKKNKETFRKLIKKLKIPHEHIIFFGFVRNDLLKKIYAQATLTLYTALNESYGLIPLESMERGVPVIAFEGGGPSETIQDGKTGYLIENYSIDDFAKKAINLIKDENLYGKISDNAKKHVRTCFNFEKSVLNLEMILKDIVSEE